MFVIFYFNQTLLNVWFQLPRTNMSVTNTFQFSCCSINIKLTFHIVIFRYIMTYACPTCEYVADTYFLKSQHLQNNVLQTTGNFPRLTLTHELDVAFNVPYIHDFITKLCWQQADLICNHENTYLQHGYK